MLPLTVLRTPLKLSMWLITTYSEVRRANFIAPSSCSRICS
jgi:hypothetical protein